MKIHTLFILLTICAALAVNAGGAPQMTVDPQTSEIAPVHENSPALVTQPAVEEPVPEPAVRPTLEELARDGGLHDLGPLTVEAIAAADAEAAAKWGHIRPGPLRDSVVRAIQPVLVALPEHAVETTLPSGEKVWTLAIRAPGAYGLRVHFADFALESGQVLIYSDGPAGLIVRGPYHGDGPNKSGEFWGPYVPGDVAFIELRGGQARVTVDSVLHFDRDPAQPTGGDPTEGAPLGCHLDVMCFGDPPVNAAARDATGRMSFVSGGMGGACTGTLLNDLDDTTFAPYFITAYHCLSTQAEVDTLQAFWFFQETPCASSSCPSDSCTTSTPNMATVPFSMGGTLLQTNPTEGGNDMTFLRLAGGLPAGIGLAGWTTAHLDPAIGIHHPAGSWKRTVFLSDTGFCPGCEFCGDGTDYDYYDFDNGLIEPGSSGSGLFNASGQLAGQLFGTCCVSAACADGVFNCAEAGDFNVQYGEFETTFPLIQYWLELGGTIHVNWTNTAPPWLGTPSDPFLTVNQGNLAAWDGVVMRIQAGSYNETVTFTRAMTVVAEGGTVVIGQ
ncbi:MAG TPA: hypothetical protein VGM03_06330 [Phycisphaerae bacterium]